MHRRRFLRGAGVSLALPLLDAFLPHAKGATAARASRTHMVCICTSLGLHAPFLFPKETGADYTLTPYLEILKDHRKDFTVFSGLSHPDQTGANGHTSEMSWLTAARFPGLGGFKNTVSLDQLAAEKIGLQTRFPSLVLGTGTPSLSYTRGGVMIPAESRPSRVFAKLFLDGTPDEVRQQVRKLREGQSIMDTVRRRGPKLHAHASAPPIGRSSTSISPRFANWSSGSSRPKRGRRSPSPSSISNRRATSRTEPT